MDDLNNESKYLRAKKRVKYIKKFYTSLLSYVVFIGFLAAINYYSNEWSYPWFLWAALGWGIGITIQAFKTFEWLPYMNEEWEEKKIREFMEKENNEPSSNRWS